MCEDKKSCTAYVDADLRDPCRDYNVNCEFWASEVECNKNPQYVKIHCLASCGVCTIFEEEENETIDPNSIQLVNNTIEPEPTIEEQPTEQVIALAQELEKEPLTEKIVEPIAENYTEDRPSQEKRGKNHQASHIDPPSFRNLQGAPPKYCQDLLSEMHWNSLEKSVASRGP